ncbi:cysteine methyltransferase [Litorivicinus lipolyticus]|uniref:Cysteine methyltransferase n=1 Tax=Litorivicinus lipolyticus TaxID=418701 RepID=A0A5Q2QCK3_9GAMM|nr:MGMT family protein [Litorivicinus lipolyticus]QGG79560.1 cysteine methyltransferase [Litorivicinus lipolyticus]
MDALSPAQRILLVVNAIPPGRFASYGQIADMAGLPRRARLVGTVLGQLPSGGDIPWHRVVNAAGRSSFVEGDPRFEYQRQRLTDEGLTFVGGRLPSPQRWCPAP